jgi:hypothetical protein
MEAARHSETLLSYRQHYKASQPKVPQLEEKARMLIWHSINKEYIATNLCTFESWVMRNQNIRHYVIWCTEYLYNFNFLKWLHKYLYRRFGPSFQTKMYLFQILILAPNKHSMADRLTDEQAPWSGFSWQTHSHLASQEIMQLLYEGVSKSFRTESIMYAYLCHYSARSNTKGYGGKTH